MTSAYREEYRAILASGDLAGAGAIYADETRAQEFLAVAKEMHAAGQVDLLSWLDVNRDSLDRKHRHFAEDFLVALIPRIGLDARGVLSAVRRFEATDPREINAASSQIVKDWCKLDEKNAEAIISLAASGDAHAAQCVATALLALDKAVPARNAAMTLEGEGQQRALMALGWVQHGEEEAKATRAALDSLRRSARGGSPLHGALLETAVRVASKQDGAGVDEWTAFIAQLVDDGGSQSLSYVARALTSLRGRKANRPLALALLQLLINADAADRTTMSELGSALANVVALGEHEAAIRFTTEFFSTEGSAQAAADLAPLLYELHAGARDLRGDALIPWLRSGQMTLCQAAVSMFTDHDDHETPVELRDELLALPANEQVFICRKAISYFFIHPVIAASIIVAFMRVTDDRTTRQLAALLFNPLLLNYSGALVEYLRKVDANHPAHVHVQKVLGRQEEYLSGLRAVGELKELHPSERQRLLEMVRTSDEAAASMKTAEQKSVFFNIFKRSTILYGKRSVSYLKGPDGELRAIDMELQPHSFSIDNPRMLISDPVGLDYILRVFCNERLAP